VDEKRVFEDIEFYFPQLAHLIIHLDQNSRNESIELLAMVISQTSVHAALQFSFAFTAALEDYQPEVNGSRNPHCNPFYFRRCARLLSDVERAVIYGGHEMTNREIDILKSRLSTVLMNEKAEMNLGDDDESSDDSVSDLSHVKKTEIAHTLSKARATTFDGELNGNLFFKRTVRKSSMHSKSWKLRYFIVDQRVLLCYRQPFQVHPLRAISLQNCHVTVRETHPKYGDTCFDVEDTANNVKYQMRAETKELRQKWVDFLNKYVESSVMLFQL
jgi:phosphatidylinositol 4-kinase B